MNLGGIVFGLSVNAALVLALIWGMQAFARGRSDGWVRTGAVLSLITASISVTGHAWGYW